MKYTIIYSIIIVLTIIIFCVAFIQFRRKESDSKCKLNYNNIVKIPFFMSIGGSLIVVLSNMLGMGDEQEKVFLTNMILWLFFIFLPLIIEIFLKAWQIELTSELLIYRTFFRTKQIKYENIIGYGYDVQMNNLYIYLEGGKRIKISDTIQFINTYIITLDLDKYNVPYLPEKRPAKYVVSWNGGYIFLFVFLLGTSVLFCVSTIAYQIWWGVAFTIPLLLASMCIFVPTIMQRLGVTDKGVTAYHLFKKPKTYTWNEIKYVCWSENGSAHYIELHFIDKKKFQVNTVWKNFWLFKKDIDEKHLKWR